MQIAQEGLPGHGERALASNVYASVTPGRDHLIDVLRAFSILVVVLLHAGILFKMDFGIPYMVAVARNAYYGVASFFVISGYLITAGIVGRYGRPERISVRQFYWMRFTRIAPFFLLAMSILSLAPLTGIHEFAIPDNATLPKLWIAALTFTFNLFVTLTPVASLAWLVLWSLSVEEMFYLLYPVVCISAGNRIFYILCAAICYGPISRYVFGQMYLFGSTFDGLAWGCLVALLSVDHEDGLLLRTFRPLIFGLGAAVLPFAYFGQYVNDFKVFGPTFIYASVAALIFGSRGGAHWSNRVFGSFAFAPLRFVGMYSYEMYLLHVPMIYLVNGLLRKMNIDWPAVLNVGPIPIPSTIYMYVLVVALTVGISFVIGNFYSEPIKSALRRRVLVRSPGV